MSKSIKYEHDIAISYAGEDRSIAGQIADVLRNRGLSVFYDKFYEIDLWGKRLSNWFKKKYGKSSRFVLVLISKHYPVKDWTDFEFSTAKEEENKRKKEFILPVMLDKTRHAGLLSDKAYLDFNEYGVDGIAHCVIEKVKKFISTKDPKEIFSEAYKEWKLHGFLPGESKTRYILDNISEINFNIDYCEFLLRSLSSGYYQDLKEKLGSLDKEILFDSSLRMIDNKESFYTKYRGIKYLIFANPNKAGEYLWNIYKNNKEDFKTKTEILNNLWKCNNKQGLDESYLIALKEKMWQLRQAAIKNIGHSSLRKDTSKILREALKDKRWEVRTEVAYAIVKLNLYDLVPDLINAIKIERSRKGLSRLLYSIWNFNSHPRVKEFMEKEKANLPNWFFKTPDCHATLDDMMDDML